MLLGSHKPLLIFYLPFPPTAKLCQKVLQLVLQLVMPIASYSLISAHFENAMIGKVMILNYLKTMYHLNSDIQDQSST